MSLSKFEVNSKMNEYFGNLALEVAIHAVKECAKKYGFDATEAIEELGLTSINNLLVFKQPKKTAKEPITSKPQMKLAKPKFPFPFSGEYSENGCHGLKYNRGLYTQCLILKRKNMDTNYCARCLEQSSKHDDGKPDCGSIEDRRRVGFMEYRDRKNRGPIPFLKVMRKLNITKDDVQEEASKYNITIDDIHFCEAQEQVKKGRSSKKTTLPSISSGVVEKPKKGGRTKKNVIVSSASLEETEVDNLFMTIATKATQEIASSSAPEPEVKQLQTPTLPPVLPTPTPQIILIQEEEESSSEVCIVAPAPPQQSTLPSLTTLGLSPLKVPKEAKTDPKLRVSIAEKEAAKNDKNAKKQMEKDAKKQMEKDAKKAKAEAEAKAKAEAKAAAKKDMEENGDDDSDEEDNELAQQEEKDDKEDDASSIQLTLLKYEGIKYWMDQHTVVYAVAKSEDESPKPIGKFVNKKIKLTRIPEKDECSSEEEQEDNYEE